MTTSRLNWAILVSVALHAVLLASFATGKGGGGGMTAQTRRLTVLLQPRKSLLPSTPPSASLKAAAQTSVAGRGADAKPGLPTPLTPIKPEYPEAALALGIPGRVEILAQVDESGHVASAVVVRTSLDGVFDRSALKAVRETRFAPGTFKGKPTKGVYRAVVLYRPK